MNALLKKHFWAVNLAGIALLAWSAAASVNAVVASAAAANAVFRICFMLFPCFLDFSCRTSPRNVCGRV